MLQVYHKWLDCWDERRAQRGEEGKQHAAFVLDAERAFPNVSKTTNLSEFCVLAEEAAANQGFFDLPTGDHQGFEELDGWLRFPSAISTDIAENNVVWTKVTESGSYEHALVVFHHWNATTRNRHLAHYFARRGITVVEIALPYHFERRRPGALHADYMLSPNLGRTIQSVRQAVLDGRKLIGWLKDAGYEKISVLGMSLGSWVAAIVAANDEAVSKASLFLTGGSLADMVWSGRATRLVRCDLEREISLTDLRRAWAPLDLENYAHRLARSRLDLHAVVAKRDKVVLPTVTEGLWQRLKEVNLSPHVLNLNCGHYSLAIAPYFLQAGVSLTRFLSNDRNNKPTIPI